MCYADLVGSGDLRNSLLQIVNPPVAVWSEEDASELNDVNTDTWDPSYFSVVSLIVYGNIGPDDDSSSYDSDSTEVSFDTDSDLDEEVSDEEEFFSHRLERRKDRHLEREQQKTRRAAQALERLSKPNKLEDELLILEESGVSDLLDEPYTLAHIRRIIKAHERKQEILQGFCK